MLKGGKIEIAFQDFNREERKYRLKLKIPYSPNGFAVGSCRPDPELFTLNFTAVFRPDGMTLMLRFPKLDLDFMLRPVTTFGQALAQLRKGVNALASPGAPQRYRSIQVDKRAPQPERFDFRITASDLEKSWVEDNYVVVAFLWNLNRETDKSGKAEQGQQSQQNTQPKREPPPGWIGIANMGGTCYFNTILQVLARIPSFLELLYRHQDDGDENEIVKQLRIMIAGLRKSRTSTQPRALFDALWEGGAYATQEDVSEKFWQIMEKLCAVLPEEEKQALRACFFAQGKRVDANPKGGVQSFDFDNCVQFVNSTGSEKSVVECFMRVKPNGDIKPTWCSFRRLPDVLFFWWPEEGAKRRTVQFPDVVDMKPCLLPGCEPHSETEYEVFAEVRLSRTGGGGHYRVFVRSDDPNRWSDCNDLAVSLTEGRPKEGTQFFPVGFFYVKKSVARSKWNIDQIADRYLEAYGKQCKENEVWLEEIAKASRRMNYLLFLPEDVCFKRNRPSFVTFRVESRKVRIDPQETPDVLLKEICEQVPGADPSNLLLFDKPQYCLPTVILDTQKAKTIAELWSTSDAQRRIFVLKDTSYKEGNCLVFFKFYTQEPNDPVRLLGWEYLNPKETDFVKLVSEKLGRTGDHEYLVFRDIYDPSGKDCIGVEEITTPLAEQDFSKTAVLTFQDRPRGAFQIPAEPQELYAACVSGQESEDRYDNFVVWKEQMAEHNVRPLSSLLRSHTTPLRVRLPEVESKAKLRDRIIARCLSLDMEKKAWVAGSSGDDVLVCACPVDWDRKVKVCVCNKANGQVRLTDLSLLLPENPQYGTLRTYLEDQNICQEAEVVRVHRIANQKWLCEVSDQDVIEPAYPSSELMVHVDIVSRHKLEKLKEGAVKEVPISWNSTRSNKSRVPVMFRLKQGEVWRQTRERLLKYLPPDPRASTVMCHWVNSKGAQQRFQDNECPFDVLEDGAPIVLTFMP